MWFRTSLMHFAFLHSCNRTCECGVQPHFWLQSTTRFSLMHAQCYAGMPAQTPEEEKHARFRQTYTVLIAFLNVILPPVITMGTDDAPSTDHEAALGKSSPRSPYNNTLSPYNNTLSPYNNTLSPRSPYNNTLSKHALHGMLMQVFWVNLKHKVC